VNFAGLALVLVVDQAVGTADHAQSSSERTNTTRSLAHRSGHHSVPGPGNAAERPDPAGGGQLQTFSKPWSPSMGQHQGSQAPTVPAPKRTSDDPLTRRSGRRNNVHHNGVVTPDQLSSALSDLPGEQDVGATAYSESFVESYAHGSNQRHVQHEIVRRSNLDGGARRKASAREEPAFGYPFFWYMLVFGYHRPDDAGTR